MIIKKYQEIIDSDLFENGPVVVLIFEKESDNSLKIVATSKNIKRVFGYNTKEQSLTNITYEELLHVDDVENFTNDFKSIIAQEIGSYDHKPYRLKDSCDMYKWVSSFTYALHNEEDNVTKKYIHYLVDITEIEDDLLTKNSELETIFSTSKDGIAILDLETKFLFFNDSYLKTTGFTKEELLSKSCAGLSAPEDLPRAIKVIGEVMEKGFVENFEKTCIVKDGKRVIVNMSIALMPDKSRILIATKDVTELKAIEKKVNDYVELINKNIITSATDLEGLITSVSEAFCEISGYREDELIGQKHSLVKHEDMKDEIFVDMWEKITTDNIWRGELKNKRKDGSYYWVYATIYPNVNVLGEKIGYTAIRQDITDKKLLEEISITDALTHLHNRRYFNELFPKIIEQSLLENRFLSFIMLDIDYFKQYNDIYGHLMGDDVLVAVAQGIKNALLQSQSYSFRLGGEEFGILSLTSNIKDAIEISEKIKSEIDRLKIEHKGSKASSYISASIGLFCKKEDEKLEPDEIYKEADKLLYMAKESGRDRICTNL
jgi:diguanylate cyclase (GGDEF)-like protein/PAS domain S-box-containing protein